MKVHPTLQDVETPPKLFVIDHTFFTYMICFHLPRALEVERGTERKASS